MKDVAKLFAMWNAGASVSDIALAFDVSSTLVYEWRRRYALPTRGKVESKPTPDPTPAEIERHKAEFRRRHLERLRTEHPEVTRARVTRERGY